jgi:hypothetical protein
MRVFLIKQKKVSRELGRSKTHNIMLVFLIFILRAWACDSFTNSLVDLDRNIAVLLTIKVRMVCQFRKAQKS